MLMRKLLRRTLRAAQFHTLILNPWRHSWKIKNGKLVLVITIVVVIMMMMMYECGMCVAVDE